MKVRHMSSPQSQVRSQGQNPIIPIIQNPSHLLVHALDDQYSMMTARATGTVPSLVT